MDSKTEFLEKVETILISANGQIVLVSQGKTTSWEVVTNAVLNAEEEPTEINIYDLMAVAEGGAS